MASVSGDDMIEDHPPDQQNVFLDRFDIAARMIMDEVTAAADSRIAALMVSRGWAIEAIRLPTETWSAE